MALTVPKRVVKFVSIRPFQFGSLPFTFKWNEINWFCKILQPVTTVNPRYNEQVGRKFRCSLYRNSLYRNCIEKDGQIHFFFKMFIDVCLKSWFLFKKKSFKSLILSIASFELITGFLGFSISSTSESLSSFCAVLLTELMISTSDNKPRAGKFESIET
ncbi:hypothetical protein BpHYR1_042895 [Brachionus plicatilis]|uniref:Uncharacterized protein n=1 Tax=Brachionus plicatilis TaxID=10195 RepID=A0A3M7SGI3_BRAPC|nr:hypothetical protein BpHYR1_042895 [Brachionus plicatilis]